MIVYIKDIAFSLFGVTDGVIDSNKDAAGKGTLQRFVESLWETYDYEIGIYIVKLRQAVKNPYTVFDKFWTTLEVSRGNDRLYLYMPHPIRRSVLFYIKRYWAIKGTPKFLVIMLRKLNFTATITEYYGSYSFDSSATLDDDVRTWDMKCNGCTSYRVDIVRVGGSLTAVTADELKGITSIIRTNEPDEVKLVGVYFNGTKIL